MADFFDSETKRNPPRLSITSLMDVLTIILIFLLTNYSEEAPDPSIDSGVSLPIIEAKSRRQPAAYEKEIKVTFGTNKLVIADDEISFKSFEDQEEQIIEVAVGKLKNLISDLSPEERPNSVITLHADRDVTYYMVDSLMRSASVAGITQIELVGIFEQKGEK